MHDYYTKTWQYQLLCSAALNKTWGEEQINTPSHDWAKHGSSAQPPLCQFWVQGCTSLWIVHEVAVYTIGLRRQITLYVHAWLPHLFQRCMFLEEELLLHCSFELQTWCDTAMLPGLSFPCPAFHVSFVILCCHLASFQHGGCGDVDLTVISGADPLQSCCFWSCRFRREVFIISESGWILRLNEQRCVNSTFCTVKRVGISWHPLELWRLRITWYYLI